MRVCGTSLRQTEEFNYMRVIFTGDGKQESELDAKNAKHKAVMLQQQHSIL